MKPKPKPHNRTPKRLYHAKHGNGTVTEIRATDDRDAMEQAFRLSSAVCKVETVTGKDCEI